MKLQEQLAAWIQGKVVIMGIGNTWRGDDGAGSLVARRISDSPGVRVIDAQDVPEHYLSLIASQRPDTVVLIDSVHLDSPPGSVALLERDQVADYWPSTHRMPLSLLMHYLEQEGHARVLLIGIQPRQTVFLQPVSAEVFSVVAEIADTLNNVLAMPRAACQSRSPDHFNREMPA